MLLQENGTQDQNCSWPIKASAYNFADPAVQAWWLDNVIKPVMAHGDGVWLDGDGPDNGGWACSGSYDYYPTNKLPAPYPPIDAPAIAAFCAGENAAQAAAHDFLFANGGMDAQACWTYIQNFPLPGDSPAACATKLLAADHLPASTAVGFGMDRTGQRGWTDATAAQTIAAFLLARDESWFFGAGGNGVSNFAPATAALLLSDFGAPLNNMTNASAFLFSREYEHATVALDCSTFTASFTPRA